MTCSCMDCRLLRIARDMQDEEPSPVFDPRILKAVADLWEFKADNAEAEARSANDFAAQDRRIGYDDRAAMFDRMAAESQDQAKEHRITAERWRACILPAEVMEVAQ